MESNITDKVMVEWKQDQGVNMKTRNCILQIPGTSGRAMAQAVRFFLYSSNGCGKSAVSDMRMDLATTTTSTLADVPFVTLT